MSVFLQVLDLRQEIVRGIQDIPAVLEAEYKAENQSYRRTGNETVQFRSTEHLIGCHVPDEHSQPYEQGGKPVFDPVRVDPAEHGEFGRSGNQVLVQIGDVLFRDERGGYAGNHQHSGYDQEEV